MTTTETTARQRSLADVVARRILAVEGAEPKALMPMRSSLLLSAVRCILGYVVIPLLLPLAGWLTPLSEPLSLLVSVAAFVMAVVALRRVWLADWSKRWGYTAFSLVLLVVLSGLITLDVRALLA